MITSLLTYLGRGLVVHRETCPNVRGYQKELDKYMAVEWSDDYDKEFITELTVDVQNRQGPLLSLLTSYPKLGRTFTDSPLKKEMVVLYRSQYC